MYMRGTLGGYEHHNIEKTGKYSNIEKKLPDTEIFQYQVETIYMSPQTWNILYRAPSRWGYIKRTCKMEQNNEAYFFVHV